MYFVRGTTAGGSDRVVVGGFRVQLAIAIPVDNNRQHLSHDVVCPLAATVADGMVGARLCFTHIVPFVHSERRLSGHSHGGTYLMTRMPEYWRCLQRKVGGRNGVQTGASA